MSEAKSTTSHPVIRQWAEERGGHPATATATATKNEPGVLRIDFPDYSGEETLQPIEWDDFFEKFDDSNLEFLYQETTDDGGMSRFCKFISRQKPR